MRRVMIAVLLTLVVLVGMAAPAFALDYRSGVDQTIAATETINDDLVIAGKSIVIDGTVNGDVFAAGTSVIVNGKIDGSLFTTAGTVEVRGAVTGSVLFVGEQIFVRGRVDRNLVTLAHTVLVDRTGSVGHSWLSAADQMQNLGVVERGAAVVGSVLRTGGQIGRELRADVSTLEVAPGAVIGGPVTYYSENPAQISEGARTGAVEHHPSELRRNAGQARWFWKPFGMAVKFGGFLLVGFALLALFPGLRTAFPGAVMRKPWQTALAGFLALIALPVAAVLAMVTVIGLPLGILALVAYPVLIYVGQICLAWTAGQFLAERVGQFRGQHWTVLFLLGALLTTVLTQLPVVGGILGAAAVFVGLGGMYFVLAERKVA